MGVVKHYTHVKATTFINTNTMVKITAADVNNLRKITGAGMMDCKKALVEAKGDTQKAIEVLRLQGQKVAAKRADRDSSEGAVLAKVNEDNTKGVIVSLNCETDFVAINEDFIALANKFTDLALNFDNKEDFLAAKFDDITVEEKLLEQTGVIGEKIEIGAFEVLEAPFVGAYIHAGNKIASLTGLSKNVEGADEVAKDVSMQVAAMNPIALDETQVDASIIEKEKEIERENLIKEGKPEHLLDNILKGMMQRFYRDNTLVHQDFIKDNKQSVAKYVKSVDKDLTVTGFKREAVG